ncbi:hypothetical protein HNY73_004582 [Argiope bruennichi]|uniref:RNA-directed DNA polymerase n=1 Tax=Argiope bruennichi TaxID=94029 RepID=A0A8T0FWA3_ARGBR|nr:hypothetical protein HNY73_004582 [Argiope bruennichi]
MKVPAILSLMGATTYKLLKNLATPNIPSELTYQDIVKLLSEHLNPKPLEMTERFRFYKRKQFEDTGAAISCMNVNEFKKLCPDVAIKPTKLLLRNFDNSMLTSAGQAVVQIQYKDQINTETIYLVHAKALKQEIASDRILCHYDPKLPLVLQTDASPVGIGAVLSHIMPDGSEKPAMFASRSLTKTERNYSQIDKEALSIVWGVNRFYQYLFGRHFDLITDHKPLVSIFAPNRSLPCLSATRMVHYALFLQAFSYTIKYRNTKNHGNADTLSRLPLTVDKDCRESEFSLQNGCIMYGHRVCIPEKYQNQVLEELHVGHPGIVKMKALARSYCYWQGIDASIANFVQNCSACIATRNEPARINRHPWEWPNGPWQRIHVDYAGPFMGKMFFVVSDAYSKWIEVIPMKNITASFTIHHLRILFAHYGIPLTLVSDNGASFTSYEFRHF